MRGWVENRTSFPSSFQITFYQGRYDPDFCSIFPVGDLTCSVPDDEVCPPLHLQEWNKEEKGNPVKIGGTVGRKLRRSSRVKGNWSRLRLMHKLCMPMRKRFTCRDAIQRLLSHAQHTAEIVDGLTDGGCTPAAGALWGS